MNEADFWAKVDRSAGCWNWRGAVDTRGYGHLRFDGKVVRAHRLAYRLAVGPIPNGTGHHGIVVMHSCDNRLCCNPAHLTLGNQVANIKDMVMKGRANRPRGEGNGRAVLTREQVDAIRIDARGTRAIAKDYPVSRAAVQRIKSGKAWAA